MKCRKQTGCYHTKTPKCCNDCRKKGVACSKACDKECSKDMWDMKEDGDK
jgi:hypothetical protein